MVERLRTDIESKETNADQLLQHFMSRGLLRLTDAGYSSLAGSLSIEGSPTVLGKAVSRDGTVHCHGYLVDRRCAKIRRVCKSSLAFDAHASVAAADQALWLQVYLAEMVTGVYHVEKIP